VIRAAAVAIAACVASRALARPGAAPGPTAGAVTAAAVTAAPAPGPAIQLAAIAPADDARRAIVIGQGGEVYEPDGKGGWVHRLASSTASPLVAAGRAGDAVFAVGDGVIYRLAGNGWSAIRLAQHGKAILGGGERALAAVGRQLFALDQLIHGEPTRLAQAPGNIVAIAAGARAVVVATETGVFRLAGTRLVAIRPAPAALVPLGSLIRPRLVSDRWAIVDHGANRGAVDLASARLTAWPAGLTIGPAAAGPNDALVAIATGSTGLELVTLGAGKLAREPLGLTGTAVGVVVDRAGRAVVALADGRIAVRDRTGWTTTTVADDPPAGHPGAAPATSG
jgi:hypothetical protein